MTVQTARAALKFHSSRIIRACGNGGASRLLLNATSCGHPPSPSHLFRMVGVLSRRTPISSKIW